MTTALGERFDRRLADEIGAFRLEMREALAALRLEMHDADAALRQEMRDGFARLRQENDAARFELLKWSFVFWIGQVFAVAGVVAIVLRLMQA